MTIQQCYEAMGSEYGEVLQRLRSEALIRKFVLKFLSDGSYDALLSAMHSGDGKAAFLAAHTLKGVAQNLGFSALYEASAALTEALRAGQDGAALLPAVEAAYERTAAAIRQFRQENP